MTDGAVFWGYGAVCLIGVVFTLMFVPETKDKVKISISSFPLIHLRNNQCRKQNFLVLSTTYSQHWVLKPPSVRGVEVSKSSAAAKARVWV